MKYFFIFCSLLFFSCEPDEIVGCTDSEACNYNGEATNDDGSCIYSGCIDIKFRHFVDEENLVLNNFSYINQSEETYSVQRLMYVLSDLKLYCENGEVVNIDNYQFINLDDISSLEINNIILPSICNSISFTFGFSNSQNTSNTYINDPNNFHNLMFWPDVIGGGYHYMKLEGKYYNSNQEEQFYNTHTGSLDGVDYSLDYIIDFVDTDYNLLYIDMNINNFYNEPIYTFENFGSGIMQNEYAQQSIFNNLNDIFSIDTN